MIITDRLLKLMSPDDRKALGKSGRTWAEAVASDNDKAERKLHSDFSGFLKRHEDELALVHHTNPTKRTRSTVGEPDYCIHFTTGKTAFVEFKINANKLSREQEITVAKLRSAGFPVLVTGSYEEAITFIQGFFS
jgi:hypothetical protein